MRQKLALTKLFWKNADFAKKILFNHGRKKGKNAYDVDGTKTSTIFVIFYKVPSLSLLWNKGHLFTKIWSKSVVHLYSENMITSKKLWTLLENVETMVETATYSFTLISLEKLSITFWACQIMRRLHLWKMNYALWVCTVCYLCQGVAPKKGKGKVKANEVWKWG